MEKYELSCNEKEKILRCIKEIIINRHPVVENRLDILYPNFGDPPTPEMEIKFRFLRIEEQDITQVIFLDGNHQCKASIPERIRINGLILKEIIIHFIRYLLTDHDHISYMNKSLKSLDFELCFDVDGRDDNMHGIGCGPITIAFDFSKHPDGKRLWNYYLKEIILSFYDQVKETGMMKREFANYCDLVKKEFLDSLTEQDLRTFVGLLNQYDLYQLVRSIPDERFIELYKEYHSSKEDGSSDRPKMIIKN